MWDRPAFKAAAKAGFQNNYWAAVAVSLILTIALGMGSGSSGSGIGTVAGMNINDRDGYGSGYSDDYGYDNDFDYDTDFGDSLLPAAPLLAFFAGLAVIAAGIGIAVKICAANPFEVGACRFFMENRGGRKAEFSTVGKGFSRNYGNVLLTQFLRDLYILLWTLLLIVPGIIKTYAYFCVPYILAENPGLDHGRAIRLSQEMTGGFKWKIFVTDLSFILWALLNMLTAGILGIFYLNPYIFGTRAEMYAFLRQRALENGISTTVELPGFGDEQPQLTGSWYGN